jgi:hypothetical protein
MVRNGTSTSFSALKHIDAGLLNVSYAEAPVITMPTMTLEDDANGAPHLEASASASKFSGRYAHRVITGGVGHNLPQEALGDFVQAVIDVDAYESSA